MIKWKEIFGGISKNEQKVEKTQTKKNSNLKSDNNKQKQNPRNKEQLVKYVLVWIVGGFISLMPTFLFLFIDKWPSVKFIDIVLMFFREADVFLVITSLAISTLLEIVFSAKNNNAKNIVVALSIIIIIISFHIFTLIKHGITLPFVEKTGNFLPVMGIILSAFCFLTCIIGYTSICKPEKKEKRR